MKPSSQPCTRGFKALAAAALSVRGLATGLVILRAALIRTGIGALIVGAGELVFQFTKLVSGAGDHRALAGMEHGGRASGPRNCGATSMKGSIRSARRNRRVKPQGSAT